jgi:ribosomal protein S27E
LTSIITLIILYIKECVLGEFDFEKCAKCGGEATIYSASHYVLVLGCTQCGSNVKGTSFDEIKQRWNEGNYDNIGKSSS